VRRLPHTVLIQHGDLPRRTEVCPLRGCQVSEEDGVTTCQHIACPNCGVGPPTLLSEEQVFYCDICGTRWKVLSDAGPERAETAAP
jgi:hypothetical protein